MSYPSIALLQVNGDFIVQDRRLVTPNGPIDHLRELLLAAYNVKVTSNGAMVTIIGEDPRNHGRDADIFYSAVGPIMLSMAPIAVFARNREHMDDVLKFLLADDTVSLVVLDDSNAPYIKNALHILNTGITKYELYNALNGWYFLKRFFIIKHNKQLLWRISNVITTFKRFQ